MGMAKPKKILSANMTGRRGMYHSDGVAVSELIQNDERAGVQLEWNGRILTLWKDGAVGVCGINGDSHLYMK